MVNYLISIFRGNRSSNKRYYLEIGAGYGIPTIICLVTGLVEAYAPWCSKITPRFAEETCFFSSEYTSCLLSLRPEISDIFLKIVILHVVQGTVEKANREGLVKGCMIHVTFQHMTVEIFRNS